MESAPGTPAPGRSLQAGATCRSPQSWAPPEPPVRRLAGPGETGSENRSTPGFRLLSLSLEIAQGGGGPSRPPPQPVPRESLGHRQEGPPELAVARAHSARRPGPSFLPPPRPATARSDIPVRVLRRAPARSRAAGSARRLAGRAARLSLRSALAALLRSGCPGEPRAACAP